MAQDYGSMTDEELRQYLTDSGQVEVQNTGPIRGNPIVGDPNKPLISAIMSDGMGDTSDGRNGWQLFGQGMAKTAMDPVNGGGEAVRTIFRGGPDELKKINAEKAEREAYDKRLMNNWQAKLGAFVPEALAAAAMPARALPQIVFQAAKEALKPSPGPVTGTVQMLTNRAQQGAEGAVAAAIPAVVLGGVGRVTGAMTGRFTPEGEEALRLNDAANRLGIKRNVGSLDQSSGLNAFESSVPGYSRVVEGQTKAFTDAAKRDVAIPSTTGKSTTTRPIEGEGVRQAIVDAGDNLKDQGRTLWNDLDGYIVQNNISPVTPALSGVRVTDIANKYTPLKKGVPNLDQNPIFQKVDEFDPDAAKMLQYMSQTPTSKYAVPFSDLHQIQSAVGKALARAERDAAAPGASTVDRQAKTELKNLYGSLMTDVDQWGTSNPAAQKMFDEARSFWRDRVVPGTINNKLYSKAAKGTYGMNPRGYSEAKNLYGDVVGSPTQLSTLTPFMPPGGRDLVDTLTTMPDVARALTTNTPHPTPSGMGVVTNLSGLAIGSPLQLGKAVVSHLPGLSTLMESDPLKKLYFSRNVMKDSPLGRLSWAASQEPQDETLQYIRGLRLGKH